MRRAPLALVVAALLCACAAQPTVTVRLADLQPLPAQPTPAVMPLRVSVAAVISPRGTLDSYEPLLAYLAARLGRPVELVQRRTYAETNLLIEQGQVDLAFVCTSAYVLGREQFGMQLLAVPEVDASTVYHSLLIVPHDSPARALADLRGGVFAFTDPMSTSGRVYPTQLVSALGSTPDRFFGRTFYTYNHENAIRAVAEGLADGAAVDSLVYRYALEREPDLALRVRVIHQSPPFGAPPVVVGPHTRPQQRELLRALLAEMGDDPEGRAALAALGVDRFVRSDDSAYDSVRALMRAAGPLDP